ncbi:MAG: peroxidase-related enzyme, partial [Gemmatimonadales bacterium]
SPDRAMLEYAHRLTIRPGEVGAADLARLRAADWEDRAIHDLCAIVAYFAFVNRIADGLAVELEPRLRG